MGAISKITILGNAGSGKTTLSRCLSQIHNLPVLHVDSIQFMAGMKVRPHRESLTILEGMMTQPEWILDGYGPLDNLQERLRLADRIVFIDLPLWRNYLWSTKRQIQSFWSPRTELPPGCSDLSWEQTLKLYRTLWKVHTQMRPELLRILDRDIFKTKVLSIRSVPELNSLARQGLL